MKNTITTYTFDASAKTIDFSAYSGFDIKRLQAVINAKTGALIYCVAVPTKGYSAFASNILTLEYDTTAMDDSDPLQILYLDNSEANLATQATLAAVLAKIIAAPATEAKQDSIIALLTALNGYSDGIESALSVLNAKDFATQTTLAALNSKDFATQTTLAAVLAKIIAAPATEAKQDATNSLLTTLNGYVDGLESALSTLNSKDFATQTTLAAVLAKIIAAPATEAKQDTANTSLAAILSKIIAAPSTEAKQNTIITLLTALNGYVDGLESSFTTLNGKDFATQTTLAAILTKIIAAPATEAKQDAEAVLIGDVREAAPASDTGSSGLNGRLQRLAQRITSLIGLFPTSLGQKTMANSMAVTLASDQTAIPMAVATATGNITTQNLVPAGNATANSAVEITLNGAANLTIQTTGTYTGALSLQVTLNGTTWVTLGGVPIINLNTGGNLATITSALQSVFQADVAGALKARITGLAAMTGTATVTLIATPAAAMVALDAALPTGANTIGAVNQGGTWTVQMGNTPNTTPILASLRPQSVGTGGLSSTKIISAASTNAGFSKASAGAVYNIVAENLNASPRYLKLYNKASAPTVGTDIPLKTYLIPGNTAGTGLVITSAYGINFSTGIAYAITTGIGDLDTGAVAANEILVNLDWA